MIALIVLFMAFYVTITPGIAPEYAGQWVGAGMTVVGVYIGSRTLKSGMGLAR
ncbi:Uncharacterised protein [uncultured archaeon]|nr:Uncharacterised protein [uncultured archaeon]